MSGELSFDDGVDEASESLARTKTNKCKIINILKQPNKRCPLSYTLAKAFQQDSLFSFHACLPVCWYFLLCAPVLLPPSSRRLAGCFTFMYKTCHCCLLFRTVYLNKCDVRRLSIKRSALTLLHTEANNTSVFLFSSSFELTICCCCCLLSLIVVFGVGGGKKNTQNYQTSAQILFEWFCAVFVLYVATFEV